MRQGFRKKNRRQTLVGYSVMLVCVYVMGQRRQLTTTFHSHVVSRLVCHPHFTVSWPETVNKEEEEERGLEERERESGWKEKQSRVYGMEIKGREENEGNGDEGEEREKGGNEADHGTRMRSEKTLQVRGEQEKKEMPLLRQRVTLHSATDISSDGENSRFTRVKDLVMQLCDARPKRRRDKEAVKMRGKVIRKNRRRRRSQGPEMT